MNKCIERLYNGIIKENPTFVLMLGMCPTLAVTTTAINGIGMGLSTTAVLVFSNLIISALRNYSGSCTYSGIHRNRSISGYHRSAAFTGICTEPVQRTGYLHPADRC